MLKQVFTELVRNYSADKNTAARFWNEIVINLHDAGRYYHDLTHLKQMYNELLEVKNQIEDWHTILFALYYHDIIYNTQRSDNEAESASLAEKRLNEIGYPENRIQRCIMHILATKGHSLNEDNDTNLFTDSDLSILGSDTKTYTAYKQNIRSEYFNYTNTDYIYGRKKALAHFLNMNSIFKTKYFIEKYEQQARINLEEEIDLLSSGII